MADSALLTLRSTKNAELSWDEVDNNFTIINDDLNNSKTAISNISTSNLTLRSEMDQYLLDAPTYALQSNNYDKQTIDTKFTDLVGIAPTTLDTLQELATAVLNNESDLGIFLTELDTKQTTLVSGTTIKTINGNSLLGSGDIVLEGLLKSTNYGILLDSPTWNNYFKFVFDVGGGSGKTTHGAGFELAVNDSITLSGRNIFLDATDVYINSEPILKTTSFKTINGNSIVGTGNIIIQAASSNYEIVQTLPTPSLSWLKKEIYVIDLATEYVCVADTLTPLDTDCFWLQR